MSTKNYLSGNHYHYKSKVNLRKIRTSFQVGTSAAKDPALAVPAAKAVMINDDFLSIYPSAFYIPLRINFSTYQEIWLLPRFSRL